MDLLYSWEYGYDSQMAPNDSSIEAGCSLSLMVFAVP